MMSNPACDDIVEESRLSDIINVTELQSIMDDFHSLTGMVTAILDMEGRVIEATGWQDICTRFHRVHPETARNCTQSDLHLVQNVKPGEYVEYQCQNGLWDVVTPLYVGDRHMGNIYTGQFFYEDDVIDENRFIRQARTYGFDEQEYMAAFRRIPRYSREKIRSLMGFLVKFASYISNVSYTKMKLELHIRERKQAEARIRESEAKLRSLINALPDLIWLKDTHGVYLSCNPKFERFFGETEANIKGRTDYDFVDRELADFFRQNDQAAINAGQPVVNEEEIVFSDDGHKEILETIKTPIYDSRQNIVGVLGIGRDITERKQSETALKEKTSQLDSILSNIKGLTYRCLLDRDGTMIYLSDWCTNLTGYPPIDFIHTRVRTFDSVIHRDDAERRRQAIVDAVGGHNTWEVEYRIVHKTGQILWVNEKGSAVYTAHDSVEYLDGLIINVSEQKKVQEKLQRSKDRFQKVFNSHIDAIFILDNNIPPRIIDCNHAVQTIFQYDKEGLVGCTVDRLHVNPMLMKKFQNALYSASKHGKTLHDFKFEMKRKDGTSFPSEHNVLELISDDGERTGWISIVRDLTEKQKTEEHLKQVQKMESIGSLAGGIAHDFNNILFPIIGMSELLLEDLPKGSPEREKVEEIYHAGRRGSDLVKQILAFSRQSEHKMIPTKIQNIIKEVIKLSRSIIPAYIEIQEDIQKDCGVVMADPTQMHQVGMNMITNAYHAVEKTGGMISVCLKQTPIMPPESDIMNIEPGVYAVLSIADNGHGMSKDILDKIFEPYFTTKEQGKGTGLGLAVVYGILKEHNGVIRVYSDIGKGTRFEVCLPLMERSVTMASATSQEKPVGGDEHVLLVDDEAAIVNLGTQMLERMGYKVTSQPGSMEALAAFSADPDAFDLVITDMAMPKMTGEQLAMEIKSIRNDIPIIICTGFSERIDDEQARHLGISALLAKPLVKTELVKKVREALDRAESRGE